MKNIIELAKQAGFESIVPNSILLKAGCWIDELKAFAALVEEAARADEREECAKVCEKFGYDHYHGIITDMIAAEIRARGAT